MVAADSYYELLTDGTTNGTVTNFTVSFQPRDILFCEIASSGSSVAFDRLFMRFNADAGNNYNSRLLGYQNSATLVDDSLTTNSFISVTYQTEVANAPYSSWFYISNLLANNKIVVGHAAAGVNAVATGLDFCGTFGGVWFNTTSQITSILLQARAGGNLNAGTGVRVFGKNF